MAESKTTRKQTKSYVTWLFEIWRSGDLHTLSSRFRLDGSLLDFELSQEFFCAFL